MHQAQAELGILADRPLGPLAGVVEQILAYHGHGAVLDDGVALVAMVHADAEEAVVFPCGHAPEWVGFEIAMRLRTLHHGDLRILEVPGQGTEPVLAHDIVGIDDGNDFGSRVGLFKAEVERARLEARPRVEVEEAESRAEFRAVFLDRFPHILALGVVVDDQHFVVGVIERGQRIKREDDHLRRLVAAGQVDRDKRLFGGRRGLQQLEVAQPSRSPQDLGEFETVDQQDEDDGELGRNQQQEHGPVQRAQVERQRHADRPDDDRHRQLDQAEEEQDAAHIEAHEVPGEPEHRQQRQQGCRECLDPPGRILDDLAGQRELRLARGIEHAPVGFDAAGEDFLPRLVDRFHHVVVDVLAFGDVEPLAQELRFVLDRGLRVFKTVAV